MGDNTITEVQEVLRLLSDEVPVRAGHLLLVDTLLDFSAALRGLGLFGLLYDPIIQRLHWPRVTRINLAELLDLRR